MLRSVKITTPSPRSEIMKLFLDPFRLSGIVSHFTILQAYEEELKKFVAPGRVLKDKIPTYFKVLYIFGTPDTGIQTVIGFLKGPEMITGGIEYLGNDEEDTFSLKLQVLAREIGLNKSEFTINVNLNYNPTLKQRILGKVIKDLKFDFANHVLTEHIVPYLNFIYRLEDVNFS